MPPPAFFDDMAINWKYEAAAASLLRFWRDRKEHYHSEGLSASSTVACPYPDTSFAGRHWRRGHAERSEG